MLVCFAPAEKTFSEKKNDLCSICSSKMKTSGVFVVEEEQTSVAHYNSKTQHVASSNSIALYVSVSTPTLAFTAQVSTLQKYSGHQVKCVYLVRFNDASSL